MSNAEFQSTSTSPLFLSPVFHRRKRLNVVTRGSLTGDLQQKPCANHFTILWHMFSNCKRHFYIRFVQIAALLSPAPPLPYHLLTEA